MIIVCIVLILLGGLLLLGAFTELNKRKKSYAIDKDQKSLTGPFVFAIVFIIAGVLMWPSGENHKSEQSESTEVLTHQDSIKRLFSAWDGTNIALVEAVKQNMNDADSFENVDTRYFDMGSYIVINMKYRGKNAFGAKVLNFIKAKQNIDGSGLAIIEQ